MVFIMTVFVWFLVPETKGVPMEEVRTQVFRRAWKGPVCVCAVVGQWSGEGRALAGCAWLRAAAGAPPSCLRAWPGLT